MLGSLAGNCGSIDYGIKKETMRPTTQAYKGGNEKVSGRTQSESITVYCDYGHIEAEEGKVGKGNGSRVTKCSSTGIVPGLGAAKSSS
jgi:hypothetical protein